MGFSFFFTLIDKYLVSKNNPSKSIQLNNENIIIDGYSFFYYMYNETQNDDKDKSMVERKTTNQFSYDGLWEKFYQRLKQLKNTCENIIVVFDGISERNSHRRPDPERESSIKFDNKTNRLPSLLYDELLSILHDLNIQVHIATGEADPVIVKMAREKQAYILACDSDYYLYELSKGYIPLKTINFLTLQGECYRLEDVFQNMTQKSVALWATTIGYDFIGFNILKEKFQFAMKNARDKKQFCDWLRDSKSDKEKYQRLYCQFILLRYLQQVNEIEAFNKIMSLVSKENHSEFEQIIKNYTEISLSSLKLTQNFNTLIPCFEELYINGKLDYSILNILINRQIYYHPQDENHIIHIRLLLPMCSILLIWDNPSSSTIIFHKQIYNVFQEIQSDDLPLLQDFIHYNEQNRKSFILGCVDFALQPKSPFKWRKIHEDYKIWLSIIKLWLHTKTNYSKRLEVTLISLTVSFVKHIFLDTYDEIEERIPKNEELPEKPYRQYSSEKLKNYFSLKKCFQLRQSIKNYAEIFRVDEIIEKDLKECEQFYKELSIINEFAKQPFNMPLPHSCFNQFTSRLAVRLSESKHIWNDVKTFCLNDDFLFDFVKELYKFISVETILETK